MKATAMQNMKNGLKNTYLTPCRYSVHATILILMLTDIIVKDHFTFLYIHSIKHRKLVLLGSLVDVGIFLNYVQSFQQFVSIDINRKILSVSEVAPGEGKGAIAPVRAC